MNTNKTEIAYLATNLAALGVKHAIISPGSRNAPLVKAFVNQKTITCISVVDERSAGFVALGIAQQTKTPTVLICTSGSALLNYAPALVEAYYQHIPLLVLSADRPSAWVDQGDGQCINQQQVFQNYCKGFWNFKEETNATTTWFHARITSEAFHTANQEPQGPAHINIPLAEPLYDMVDQVELTPNIIQVKPTVPQLSAPSLEQIAAKVNDSKRVMLIIGQHAPCEILKTNLHRLSKLNQVVVLTETTANLFGNGFIDQIDRVLATIPKTEVSNYAPDLLITIGGMVVSKRLKAMLRAQVEIVHWHISEDTKIADTYQKLNQLFVAQPQQAIASLADIVCANNSQYRNQWQSINALAKQRHAQFASNSPYSDFQVFHHILQTLPDNCQLQLGNSTIVRYAQLFDNNTTIDHYCNRGVSGIDGCTSTAVGASLVNNKKTVFISGEIAFLYDNNALWNPRIPDTFLAIVINNGGGNIFKFIEGPDQFTESPEFIETQHNLSIEPLANLHGFQYFSATSITELKEQLLVALNAKSKTILEIFTPRDVSPQTLRNYFKFLQNPKF